MFTVFDLQSGALAFIILLLLVPYIRGLLAAKTPRDGVNENSRSLKSAPVRDGDAERQLAAIKGVSFKAKPLMNEGEYWAFKQLEDGPVKSRPGLRLFAQVSLGEVLRADDNDAAFLAINAKRVDALIVDSDGTPLLASEFQGAGHYQGDAVIRDATKKEALRSAGIEYLEIFPGDESIHIHNRALELIDRARRKGTNTRTPHIEGGEHAPC
jgi:Protein of unknown function (DUF2726).